VLFIFFGLVGGGFWVFYGCCCERVFVFLVCLGVGWVVLCFVFGCCWLFCLVFLFFGFFVDGVLVCFFLL